MARIGIIFGGVGIVAVLVFGAWLYGRTTGYSAGGSDCRAEAAAARDALRNELEAKASADIRAAQAASIAAEETATRLSTAFKKLSREARHEADLANACRFNDNDLRVLFRAADLADTGTQNPTSGGFHGGTGTSP